MYKEQTTKKFVDKRQTLNKIARAGALGGVVASMPKSWVKPVVDTIVLPTHAMMTPEVLPTLEGVGANVTTPNPSGNIGTFELTISSPDATSENPITINTLVPTSGSFIDFTPGVQITTGSPITVTWVSDPGFVDGTTGIVLAGMFAGATAGVSGADSATFDFTIAEEGDAP
jgi:hypothetical protein